MADDLHDADFFAWTRQQATALRQRRHGENALDYDNLAEEIEDVGNSQLHACESWVDRILEHFIKLELFPANDAANHWRAEILAFRRDLRRRLTTTIRNEILANWDKTLDDIVRDAVIEYELKDRGEALAARLRAYSWEQVVDRSWFPTPSGD